MERKAFGSWIIRVIGMVFLAVTAGLSSMAAVELEESYPLQFDGKDTVVHQILISGNTVPVRFFYIPSKVKKETTPQKDDQNKDTSEKTTSDTKIIPIKNTVNAPVVFIPNMARGRVVTDDLQAYLLDFSSYIAAALEDRDVYIFPGPVVEGSDIHHCGLFVSGWETEFLDWKATKDGIKRCLRQLDDFPFDLSAFSATEMAKGLSLLIKDEELKKPIIWSLGSQERVVNILARDLGDQLGGIVLDTPDLAYRPDAQDSFDAYLKRVDALAKDKKRGWKYEEKPSQLLSEMIQDNNKGSIYKGDISDIGYNEDINTLFPVNGDVLNYYMLSKADQPGFLADLGEGNSSLVYSQYAPFSIENYRSVSSFPEVYRNCIYVGGADTALAFPALKETFERDLKRQKAICEALGAPMQDDQPAEKIKVPTAVIMGAMNPYYSPEATQKWMDETYTNAALITLQDGSLGTPECVGKPLREVAKNIIEGFTEGKLESQSFDCGWVFTASPTKENEQ